jgi:hypothetical protein
MQTALTSTFKAFSWTFGANSGYGLPQFKIQKSPHKRELCRLFLPRFRLKSSRTQACHMAAAIVCSFMPQMKQEQLVLKVQLGLLSKTA